MRVCLHTWLQIVILSRPEHRHFIASPTATTLSNKESGAQASQAVRGGQRGCSAKEKHKINRRDKRAAVLSANGEWQRSESREEFSLNACLRRAVASFIFASSLAPHLSFPTFFCFSFTAIWLLLYHCGVAPFRGPQS